MSVLELPRPVVFVLGGAASAGAAQVGMLRAVAESGLRPDLIVGTSAGALNGVILADDPEGGPARLAEVWTALERRSIVSTSRVRLLRNLARRQFMYRDTQLAALFGTHVRAQAFEQLALPFACVATDLDARAAAILDRGPLLSALLASCAIPGAFPLVERDGRWLADGVCVANVPVREALALGAASIIVFDGRPRLPRARRGDVRQSVFAAFDAALTHQLRCDLEFARERVRVVHLPGQPDDHLPAFSFERTAELIDASHAAVAAFLQTLRAAEGVPA